MSNEHGDGLAQLPGFAALAPSLQALLRDAEAGNAGDRAALLERVADVLNVFIALELVQFVFMPPDEPATPAPPPGGIAIDLIAPAPEPDSSSIAWFNIDEAGYDEYRDAVTLFGNLADVLNPPIVLDLDDEVEGIPAED